MRIAVAHDFFRSTAILPALGNADDNGQFLSGLISPVLRRLGHDMQRLSEIRQGRTDALTALLARNGWQPGLSTWAHVFSDPAYAAAIQPMLASMSNFDLVIGWELTPNMLRFLVQRNVRFLDIGIDPIRFAPDLFLRIRSNDPRLIDRLAEQETPDSTLAAEATRLRAALPPPSRPRAPAVVFAGQMEIDASLVVDGVSARVDRFIPQIASLLRPDQMLLLKPHPHGAPHTDVQTLHAAFPESLVVDENIYALLGAPWVDQVVTLSSSVADEAALFGKPATRLIAPDHAPSRTPPPVSRPFRIDQRFTTLRFWSDLLTRARGGRVEAEPAPRPIRQMFTHRWGHTDWPPPPRPPAVRPGDELHFGAGFPGHALCVIGWGEAEEWGVWSDSDLATLLFDPVDAPRGIAVELHLTAFVPPARPMRFDLSVRPCGPTREVLLESSDVAPLIFEIPPEFCRGAAPVEIAFRFHALVTPASLGDSNDHRRLGVGLRRVLVRSL